MQQIMYQTGYAFLNKARNQLILRILKTFTYKTYLLYEREAKFPILPKCSYMKIFKILVLLFSLNEIPLC